MKRFARSSPIDWNGVFWRDDSQIVDLVIRKRFARDGRTGVEVVIDNIWFTDNSFEDVAAAQPELAPQA